MADLGQFGDVGSTIFDTMVSGAVWVIGGILLGGALAFIMYWFLIYKRKFDIEVKVLSQRADNKYNVVWDKAAILTDRKNKQRYFRLWNFKIEIPVPKFEILQSSGGKDYLEMYQKSDEEFYFLTPPKLDKEYILKTDGTSIPFMEYEQKIMDAEVAYWNVKRKDQNKELFSKDKMWVKLLELAPQILTMITMIFILWLFLDKLPGILNELKQLSAELNSYNRVQTTAEVIGSLLPLSLIKWGKKE